MNTNNHSAANLNDLIFENRNKSYGAYQIRKVYNDNLSIALFSTVSFFAVSMLLAFLFTNNKDSGPKLGGQLPPEFDSIFVDVTPYEKPEQIEKKIPKEIPQDIIPPKTDDINYKASDNEKDITTKTNTDAAIIPNGRTDGSDSASIEPAILVASVPPAIETGPVIVATNMPEFNGNLFQYLRDNLKYPDDARYNLTSGTVYLQFVVEKDGSIDNVKVLKPVPDGCTEEAIRVIKSMPRWKPGKNHGEAVRVLYNLPVKFTIK
ncbi:MAG: TonB family protein [Bacteroidota bacterium]